jgi:AcrR family transcriptional regulator
MGIYERQQKEKKILEAAIKLFSQNGFYATKVEDVAKEARISKGLVYFYYKSKEDLYMAITKKGFDELKEIFNKAFSNNKENKGIDVIVELVEEYFLFAKEKKIFHEAILFFFSCLDQYNADKERMNKMVLNSNYFNKLLTNHHDIAKLGIKALSMGIKDGSIRPDLQAESAFYTLWSMLIGNIQLNGTIHQETKDIKINAESWKNGFMKLFLEILKGSHQDQNIKPFQGKLF